MIFLVRLVVFLVGLLFLLLGVIFMWGISQFSNFWLNAYLFGATLMAYAIPLLWIGVTRSYKALAGGGLALFVTFGAIGLYLLRLHVEGLIHIGEISLALALLGLWFLIVGIKIAHTKKDRLPVSTQWLMALVLTIALIQGLFLIVPLPTHFPWMLSNELSVIYGWVLIGASLFFGWTLFEPIWENGYPLLYAILVYDALLIGPFLSLLNPSSKGAIAPLYLWMAVTIVMGSGVWALLELIGRFFSVRKI